MNKKYKIIAGTSVIGLVGIITPILVTSCSVQKNIQYSSLWNLDNNKKTLYLENHNLGNNLDDINVYDNINDQMIEFDRQSSMMTENQLFINFSNNTSLPNSFRIINKTNNYTKIINNTDTKTFKEYDLIKDQEYFFKLIQNMSINGIPTFGILRNASLVLQQAFYIALVNYFSNSESESNRTFMFGPEVLWKENRFNQDILIDNNIWTGNKNQNVEKYSKFNLFQNDNISTKSSIMIQNFTKILENTNDEYFDFFHDEIEFVKNIENFNSDYFKYLFRKANKIVVLSDGAYHTNDNIPKLTEMLNSYKSTRTRKQTIQLLKDLRENKIKSLNKNDVLDVLLLKNYEITNENSEFNYISFVNYDANVFNATSLNDDKQFNESAFSTNFVDYKEYINVEENKQKYLDVYSKLFVRNGLTREEIFINGNDNYNPNKKNAIFLGSGLFRPLSGAVSGDNYSRLVAMPSVLNEIQNTFKKFLDKYNPNEYNIIFKLHPIFSNANDPKNLGAINYVKLISNNLINNPIIVSSNIPLESWVSLDYNNYKQNPNNIDSSIIFRQNQTTSADKWTTFFGLQATSTTIHTTRLFYQSAFKLSKEQVAELIPFSNFPVPKLFSVTEYLKYDNDSYDYTQINKNAINNIYKPFCPSITYSPINSIDDLTKYDSIVLNF